jgi:hypothetical protein
VSPDPVGSLAEEAARLISALSSLSCTSSGASGSPESSTSDDPSDAADPHDPLAPECRYCPVCALARTARSMTPEVREHLASAAASLLLAGRDFLEVALATSQRAGGGEPPVENIDVAED